MQAGAAFSPVQYNRNIEHPYIERKLTYLWYKSMEFYKYWSIIEKVRNLARSGCEQSCAWPVVLWKFQADIQSPT